MGAAQVHAALEKLKALQDRFDAVPRESFISIMEEAAGKILLLPEAQAIEADGIAIADSASAALAAAVLPPGLNALGVVAAPKATDLMLHAFIAWLEHTYKDAVARGQS